MNYLKKQHKQKLKKGIYIAILIVFTTVSILPAANIFTDKNSANTGIPMDEKSIKEMFGENAEYDPKTGSITYTEDKTEKEKNK